ncbi:hypothetical protein BDV59DRAFT_196630 [Aspergillus ambiguus]|uniref:uncharacterized protein n=1 Tax=Aspergillus ambiguus TaxID=176160 RepID=UPI003CCCBB79
MHPFPRRALETVPEDITPADHEILLRGGTSSSIERLPSRLQRSKRASTDLHQQLEDLTYEVSYLKAELQWEKESKQTLLCFQDDMFRLFHQLEMALAQVSARLKDCEKRYYEAWGFSITPTEEGMI